MTDVGPMGRTAAGPDSDGTTLFTIGHSTRSIDDFIALLKREGIRHLADVRTFPMSRRYPHFNGAALAAVLQHAGIVYTHHAALGGRRTPRPDSVNTAWRNSGFRGYADHMQTSEFREALDALLDIAATEPTTVMCAEAVPWRCHRSLIADAAIARGVRVLDIMDARHVAHAITSFAVVDGERVTYPASADPPSAQGTLFEA